MIVKHPGDHDMQLFVKTQSGKIVITLDVVPEDTIQDVKRKIIYKVGTPIDKQNIIQFDHNELEDDRILRD